MTEEKRDKNSNLGLLLDCLKERGDELDSVFLGELLLMIKRKGLVHFNFAPSIGNTSGWITTDTPLYASVRTSGERAIRGSHGNDIPVLKSRKCFSVPAAIALIHSIILESPDRLKNVLFWVKPWTNRLAIRATKSGEDEWTIAPVATTTVPEGTEIFFAVDGD